MGKSIRTFEMVETSRFRARVAAAIESLVDLLDSLEDDPDLEPDNDDEPSLSWEGGQPGRYFPEGSPGVGIVRYDDADRERDAGDGPEGPDADREFTSLERHGSGFVYSGPDDCEMNGDEDDDDGDTEPSLGWVTRENGGTYCGVCSDREQDAR
ncbi:MULTISPECIES: hypothetical protein [unclassified Xanthobacter]|uniref:hypothetical protein n=1 Tax=unclassified Xanthobacter TaxID=2623496 RepID=UPI001EDEECE9|nr:MULTISPECIES: hypothetical protein [unclassified Xanthobacter]